MTFSLFLKIDCVNSKESEKIKPNVYVKFLVFAWLTRCHEI